MITFNSTGKQAYNFYHKPSSSNCKLTYWESANNVLQYDSPEVIEAIKQFLASYDVRIVVAVNLNTYSQTKILMDNFEIFSCNKIPVGYHDGFQYHILIRNVYSKEGNIHYLRELSESSDELRQHSNSSSKIKSEDVIKETIEKIKKNLTDALNSRKFLKSTKKFIIDKTFGI